MSEKVEDLGLHFSCTGMVLGNMWGGGSGVYETRLFEAENYDTLVKIVEEAFYDRTLDKGFGFESLVGAFMVVTESRSIKYKGLNYVTKLYRDFEVGHLEEESLLTIQSLVGY